MLIDEMLYKIFLANPTEINVLTTKIKFFLFNVFFQFDNITYEIVAVIGREVIRRTIMLVKVTNTIVELGHFDKFILFLSSSQVLK